MISLLLKFDMGMHPYLVQISYCHHMLLILLTSVCLDSEHAQFIIRWYCIFSQESVCFSQV